MLVLASVPLHALCLIPAIAGPIMADWNVIAHINARFAELSAKINA